MHIANEGQATEVQGGQLGEVDGGPVAELQKQGGHTPSYGQPQHPFAIIRFFSESRARIALTCREGLGVGREN